MNIEVKNTSYGARQVDGIAETEFYKDDEFYIPPYMHFMGRNMDSVNFFHLIALWGGEKVGTISFHQNYVKEFGKPFRGLMKVLLDRISLSPSLNESVKKETFTALLNQLEESRTRVTKLVEVEAFSDIRSPLFFPSTLSRVGAYVPAQFIEPLREKGFQRVKEKFCFEGETEKVPQAEGLKFRKIRMSDENDMHAYADLWKKSRYNTTYSLLQSKKFLPVWSVISNFFVSPDYIIFAVAEGEIAGMIQWWPDIHPILREDPSSLFVHEERVPDLLRRVTGGKIFKLVVKREFQNRDIELALCQRAAEIMRNRGIIRCQIGNVDEDDTLLEVARQLKFKRVATLQQMEKTFT